MIKYVSRKKVETNNISKDQAVKVDSEPLEVQT